MDTNRTVLDSAVKAAKLAADHIRSVERPVNPSSWEEKGTCDFVTQIDTACERLIAELLLREHPGSVVMGEELTPEAAGTPDSVTWIVDPLDGTINYLHDYEAYAVSVAAMMDNNLIAGVVVDVTRERIYHGTAGGGAWCDGRRLRVSTSEEPALALIGTGFPFKVRDMLPQYLRQFTNILTSTSGIRRAGSAALDLADLASGRLDGFWELSLAPWDVAAGTLLVREAGGVVTDTAGHDAVVRQGPIVAGNPKIHTWLLNVLKRDLG